MRKKSKIYVAGHTGLVGSAILANLIKKGYTNIVTRSHQELDLTNQCQVKNFFLTEKPEYVILAAAKVGGIVANNKYRAEYIYNNLMIQNNVIHHSYLNKVKKLLFLGSSCIYPKNCSQPIIEESLLTAQLEYTNEPYSIAKISGLKMCESYNLQYSTNFISVMPTNLYGPNDSFDLEKAHVLPSLLRKFFLAENLVKDNWSLIKKDLNMNPIDNIDGSHNKKQIVSILKKYGIQKKYVEVWGSGKPMREFLWSEDLAEACIFILNNVQFKDVVDNSINEVRNTHINIGTGKDVSIKDLANLIKCHVGYKGDVKFNTLKPDGTMKKLTDVSKLNKLGWKYSTSLIQGIEKIHNWYLKSLL